MNLLDSVYRTLEDKDIRDNPFESEDFNRLYRQYYDDYVKNSNNEVRQWENLIGLISYTQENAFKVGFKAALRLVAEGLEY